MCEVRLEPTCRLCYDTGITYQDYPAVPCNACHAESPLLTDVYSRHPDAHPGKVQLHEGALLQLHYHNAW